MVYQAGSDAVVYTRPRRDSSSFSPRVRSALERIARQVNSGDSIDGVLDCVWSATDGIIPRDRIGLSFIERDGLRVTARCFKAAYGDVRLGESYSASLAGSSLKALMDSGGVRIIPDLAYYLALHPESHSTRLILAEGVKANITLPLSVGERRVGFMFFSCRQPLVYEEEHAQILLEVVDRIAQAVEKAWIIARLEEAKGNYLEMLGFVAHELKSPLAGLMARGTTYLDGYKGEVQKEAAEVVRAMNKTAGYLSDMVSNYIDLSRLESGEMRYEPEDGVRFLRDVFQWAQDTTAAHASQRGARLKVDAPAGDILLHGDPVLLRTLMVNLLDNAVKYGVDAQEVRVSVSVSGGRLTVTVRNEGVGFTEEQSRMLFKRFSRLRQKGLEDRKGSGLGLYLAWWVAQKHGGRLSASSEPGRWAEFAFSLPGARPTAEAAAERSGRAVKETS
ncbi:MAG: GAF domain-containing sensor histidine kinase [Elusimicrobiota bacterium]